MHMEDKKIVDLFLNRSEDAISELSRKYGRLAHRIANNLLGNPADAEEVVNDAWLGMWNTIPPEHPDPLVSYLCKLVRNQALKRYQYNTAGKRNNHYDVALEELEESLSCPELPEDVLSLEELTGAIDGWLAGLSKTNRVIFLRRYWFSDSYEEIAKAVGLSAKNISVRLTRLRSQLRQYLIEREFIQ